MDLNLLYILFIMCYIIRDFHKIIVIITESKGKSSFSSSVYGQRIDPQHRHPCDRPCKPEPDLNLSPDDKLFEPMECFYTFVATFTRTLVPEFCGNCRAEDYDPAAAIPNEREESSEIVGNLLDCYSPGCAVADGAVRPIFLINDELPGPEIRVCENDIVVVNVMNKLQSGESLTIHWHGVHQESTPWMDGTPMISQCDIIFGSAFEYKFLASPAGTKFWHAHSALLRDQGLAGAFMIRDRGVDAILSEQESVIYPTFENDQNPVAMVQDWTPDYTAPLFVHGSEPKRVSLIVNGRQGIDFRLSPPSYFTYLPHGQKPYLRIVSNGFLNCPISLTVEGHRITIVRADGFPVEPATVDKIYLFAAERYDVFLEPHDALSIVMASSISTTNRNDSTSPVEAADNDNSLSQNPESSFGGIVKNLDSKSALVFTMIWEAEGYCKDVQQQMSSPTKSTIELQEQEEGDESEFKPSQPEHVEKESVDYDNYWNGPNFAISYLIYTDNPYLNRREALFLMRIKRSKKNLKVPLTKNDGPSLPYPISSTRDRDSRSIDKSLGNSVTEGSEENGAVDQDQKEFLIFNPVHLHDFHTHPDYVHLIDLVSINHSYHKIITKTDYTFYLYVDRKSHNTLPNINGITFTHPSFPLVSQYADVPSNNFCNVEDNPECEIGPKICKCLHMYPIYKSSVVEIVLVDEGQNNKRDIHPFHLHGYAFAVLGQERLGNTTTLQEVKNRDHRGELIRLTNTPPYKDTVAVPDAGYTIIRFRADNPGFWMLHCHLGFHLMGGMSIMFKIGEIDEMISAPKDYPKCGSWIAMDQRDDHNNM